MTNGPARKAAGPYLVGRRRGGRSPERRGPKTRDGQTKSTFGKTGLYNDAVYLGTLTCTDTNPNYLIFELCAGRCGCLESHSVLLLPSYSLSPYRLRYRSLMARLLPKID